MRAFSHPLFDSRRRIARASGPSAPLVERLLRAIGADPAFADDVLGDLVQERARRVAEHGTAAARRWYLREALRAAPHLVRNAATHGGPDARLRLAMVAGAVVLVPLVAVVVMTWLPGPPARLVAGGPGGITQAADGVVINTLHPVRLAMQVFDAKGHRLAADGVRYRWVSGDSLAVSATGVATCSRDADAFVHASLGAAATTVPVHCRPVQFVHSDMALALLVGDSAHDLRWRAYGPDGRRVEDLTGTLRVADSTVATLHGNVVRPVAPGRTQISIDVGDGEGMTEVDVYERVHSFRGLRKDQLYVAAPVLLPMRGAIHWPLPKGEFWVRYNRPMTQQAIPTFTVDGRVVCVEEPSMMRSMTVFHCAARDAHGSILLRNLDSPTPISGILHLERRNDYLR